jgi:hypothetical protein
MSNQKVWIVWSYESSRALFEGVFESYDVAKSLAQRLANEKKGATALSPAVLNEVVPDRDEWPDCESVYPE